MARGRVELKGNESGFATYVAFLIFLPVFFAAILLLVEFSRMQSMKTMSDTLAHAATNAAARQVDYESLYEGTLALRTGDTLPSNPYNAESSLAFVNDGLSAMSDAEMDSMTAEDVARMSYGYAIAANGLNTGSGLADIAPAAEGLRAVVDNTPTPYADPVTGKMRSASLPLVRFWSVLEYRPLPLVSLVSPDAAASGVGSVVTIGSYTAAQLVTDRSGTR